MIAMIFDYLVSDASVRSEGAIAFPDFFIENTANLFNNIYLKDGEFYGDSAVTLWMPKGLAHSENQELNYIAARGNNKLYLAFTNQSHETVSTTVTLDQNLVQLNNNKISVYEQNVMSGVSYAGSNSLDIEVSPDGITAVIIEDVDIHPSFQQKMHFITSKNNWKSYYEELVNSKTRAMLLNMSDSLSRIYVYSQAAKGDVQDLQIECIMDGVLQETFTDDSYPFEYSIAVPRSVMQVDLNISSGGQSDQVTFIRDYTVSGSITGWTSVRQDKEVPITFLLNGDLPWTITYTDGRSDYTREQITESVYTEMVYPGTTSIYRLLSASDGDQKNALITNDKIKVSVTDGFTLDQKLNASKDAFVYQLGPGNKYGEDPVLKIKGTQDAEKVSYIEFSMPDIQRNGEKYLLGLWLNAVTEETMLLQLSAGEADWDEASISWNSGPVLSGEVLLDTIGISGLSEAGSFHYFDISSYIQNASGDRITFRIASPDSNLVNELQFASLQDSDPKKHPCIISDAVLGIKGQLLKAEEQALVFPVPATDHIQVKSSSRIDNLILISLDGKVLRSENGTNSMQLGDLPAGNYILKVVTPEETIQQTIIIL